MKYTYAYGILTGQHSYGPVSARGFLHAAQVRGVIRDGDVIIRCVRGEPDQFYIAQAPYADVRDPHAGEMHYAAYEAWSRYPYTTMPDHLVTVMTPDIERTYQDLRASYGRDWVIIPATHNRYRCIPEHGGKVTA